MDTRIAWERFQLGEELVGVRREILTSWRRSQLSGVDPSRIELPRTDIDFDSRFARSAIPVVSATAQLLGTTDTCLAITDAAGTVVWRWTSDSTLRDALDDSGLVEGSAFGEEFVGTNGLGTALELRRATTIRGGEHFKEHFHRFACAAAPVIHPLTRRTVGAINITCPVDDANPMLEPTILKLVREIEHALFAAAGARERKLFDEFLATRSESRQPVITLSSDVLIANEAAAHLQIEHRRLWASVLDAIETGGSFALPGTTGHVARMRPVTEGRVLTGAVVVVEDAPDTARQPIPPEDPVRRAADDARRALAAGRLLVVRGEPGSGKQTLLRTLLAERDASPVVLDASEVALTGMAAWTAPLREPPDDRPVLLRHLDQLAAPDVRTLAAGLGRLVGRRTVTATWTASASDAPGGLVELLEAVDGSTVELPPLRQRREEITGIAAELAGDTPLHQTVLPVLEEYRWPGNVAELRQALLSAARQADGRRIDVEHLPEYLRRVVTGRRLSPLERAEAAVIAEALSAARGNKSVAARELGVSRPTLYSKIKTYRL